MLPFGNSGCPRPKLPRFACDPHVAVNPEAARQPHVLRRGGSLHQNLAVLNLPLHVLVQKGQLAGVQSEGQPLFLPGLQVDPGETRQLLDRAGHTGVHVGDVELGHLVSGDWTGVLHGEGNLHALSRRDFLPGNRQVRIGKAGVGQAKAKGIARPVGAVHIVGKANAFALVPAGAPGVAVVHWHLPGVVCHGHGQLPARGCSRPAARRRLPGRQPPQGSSTPGWRRSIGPRHRWRWGGRPGAGPAAACPKPPLGG